MFPHYWGQINKEIQVKYLIIYKQHNIINYLKAGYTTFFKLENLIALTILWLSHVNHVKQ